MGHCSPAVLQPSPLPEGGCHALVSKKQQRRCYPRPEEAWNFWQAEAGKRPDVPAATLLREITSAVVGRPIEYDETRLAEVLSPEYFVRVRTTPGGPAPVETARAAAASRERLTVDEGWMKTAVEKLRRAEGLLRAAVEDL